MRSTLLVAFPALALVAQAPAPTPAPAPAQPPVDYRQQFNAELPGINQMLSTFQAKEAMAKAGSLIPAQRPAFDGTNLQTIVRSMEQAEGLLSMYRMWASTAMSAGQWEKAQDIQAQRLAVAQAVQQDLAKGQQPIQAMWDKAVADGKAYIAANQPRQADLEAKVKAFKDEFAQVQADMKSGKKHHSKQEIDDLNARGKMVPQQEQEIAQIGRAIKLYQDNEAKAQIVGKYIAENTNQAAALVKDASDDLAKIKATIASQTQEITDFNQKEAQKKVKVVGNRTWVDAVLREHENITKLPGAQSQAAFLNRLLVLDPGNPMAEKVLKNLTEGKELFAKEPVKPVRKTHPRRKK